MAQSTTRRFYIDSNADHTVVHRVPVHKADWQPAPVETAATHQVTPAAPSEQSYRRSTQRRVSQLLRNARKRHQTHAS